MRLRSRLALSVVAAALPLAAGSVWVRHDLEQRRVAQVLREFALTRMQSGGRARCEADPATFPPRHEPVDPTVPPPPPPPPEVGPMPDAPRAGARRRPPRVRTLFWAYDDALVSANPRAPEVPAELASAIGEGEEVALRSLATPQREGYEALVRMPWTDSPCAFLLVRRTRPGSVPGATDLWWTGVVVAAGVLVAVLLASGHVVRRIRKLEADVHRSTADRYGTQVAVTGRDELTDLARAFNDAAGQVREHLAAVEHREKTLRDFVANTTHDVMTPLTVLQGHLDALRRVVGDDAGAREELRDAVREVDYTTALVANLAASAKLQADPLDQTLHRVEVNGIVERVCGRHRSLARAQGVELNHAVPEEILATMGDVTLFEQAVGNAVQNGIRYTRRDKGHVAVVLRADGPGHFEIRVVDDGPGLSDADLARITQRGFRGAAGRTRGSSGHGLGLGLDITRGVCERYGIDLSFECPENGGLVVRFRGDRIS